MSKLDDHSKIILGLCGIDPSNIDDTMIERDLLLDNGLYEESKQWIPELKQHYSSSFMTSLQNDATTSQKWPFLNLIRQILNVHGYKMEPIRKADGYTVDGVKKFKRFFHIKKK
jgi:hypothetical protein